MVVVLKIWLWNDWNAAKNSSLSNFSLLTRPFYQLYLYDNIWKTEKHQYQKIK